MVTVFIALFLGRSPAGNFHPPGPLNPRAPVASIPLPLHVAKFTTRSPLLFSRFGASAAGPGPAMGPLGLCLRDCMDWERNAETRYEYLGKFIVPGGVLSFKGVPA